MEQIVAIVYDDEKEAQAARVALRDRIQKGHVTVYGGALIVRNIDRSVTVRDFDDFGVGTAVGSFIALLNTPKGLLAGSRSFAIGAPFDDDHLETARVSRDFVDEVSAALAPARFAIVAEIDEHWTTPLDAELQSAGGKVFRCSLRPVSDELHDVKTAAMNAALARLQEEASSAKSGSRVGVEMRIEQLQRRIEARQKQARARREALEARWRLLETKTLAARGRNGRGEPHRERSK